MEARPEAAEEVKRLLAGIAGTSDARVKDYGTLQFIDSGGNFENITCPGCYGLLNTKQWHTFMDEDWHGEDGFHLQLHRLPCCGESQSLNDMIYAARQGFACWFIGARVDNRGALTSGEVRKPKVVAQVPLSAIIQRY